MKIGDLVLTINIFDFQRTYYNFWREADKYDLHRYQTFKVYSDQLLIVHTPPFDIHLDHTDHGKRIETHIRVIHPEHGIIRGFANWVEEAI